MRGIEIGCVPVPLHTVHLVSDLVSGCFRVGVQSHLPIKGVALIMGNDLARGKVVPVLEVHYKPDVPSCGDVLATTFPDAFPACVITRGQSRRLGSMVDLTDSVLAPMWTGEEVPCPTSVIPGSDKVAGEVEKTMVSSGDGLRVPLTREKRIASQKEDRSLAKCFATVVKLEKTTRQHYIEDGLLMKIWKGRIGVRFSRL